MNVYRPYKDANGVERYELVTLSPEMRAHLKAAFECVARSGRRDASPQLRPSTQTSASRSSSHSPEAQQECKVLAFRPRKT